jgi:hypothetical protein
MMRFAKIALPALALAALASCQTYQQAAIAALRNVAVVSVQVDRRFDTSAIEEFRPFARDWPKSPSFDLVPAANRVATSVFASYARSLPVTFVPEQQLLAMPAYQALATDGTMLLEAKDVTVATGYAALPADATTAKALAERFPDVDAFLWAQVTCTLVDKGAFKGTRFVRVRADLTLTAFDRRGRAILRHTEGAEDSTEMRIPTISMVPPGDFAAAAHRATAAASSDMSRWLEKRSAR